MANVITLEGGDIVVSAILDGGDIYPSGGGGGGLLQTKSVSYTPTESAQTDAVTADPGYDGLEEVDVTIGAISSTYVGSGVTRQAAQIIHPSTSDQSIPSGTYLTGAQGFKAVTTTNLTSGNIKNGVTVKVGDSSDDDRIISVTGTYSGGGANLESKSVSYTPTETAITVLVTPSTGYDGLSQVDVTVDAISSSYVGSAITRRDSSDLSASGATVTAPSGYYASSASKAISNASQELTDAYVLNSGDLEVELNTGTAGYVSSGNQYLQFENFATPQSAQTIYPSASDQTIPAYTYTFGAQTIKGVTYSGLDASNIKKDVVVKIGDSADDDRILSVTGTYEGGGGGGISLNDIFSRQITGDIVINISPETFSSSIMSDFYGFFRKSKITSIKSTGLAWIPPHFVNMDGTTNNLTNRPLISVEMDAQYCGAQAFKYCSNLATVKLYDLEYGYFNYMGISSSTFEGCTSLTTVAFPKLTRIEATFMKGCTSLTAVDFGALATISGQNHFQNCSAMNVLIIRTSSVATLANINTFANTPFASGKAGGTLYVPNSLISSYQSASNWSTILGYATNSIQKIEGSIYETTYADGSPVS